ncbi:hypothetical protein PCASD_11192 [Puccinia coronata f. sp. avenae]|uniref:Uncharacterized protein n=1 Tax=Puccinia coronata f. sp. avenae TaxID=200324 RepID=A0A2N5UFE0_9BASI|nr:hypothetical protein PCASD_11192 [Puccinia coronata f. sp. avenae]
MKIPKKNATNNKCNFTSAPDSVANTTTVNGLITNIVDYNYATVEPLDPPPSAQFHSMDDLLSFCQKCVKQHG